MTKTACIICFTDRNQIKDEEASDSDSENEIGGLFRIAKHEQEKKTFESDNGIECSKFVVVVMRDWTNEKVCVILLSVFTLKVFAIIMWK